MVTIVPAILATTEAEYKDKLSKIEDSNQFEWVQIDLMDGQFVKNKSVGVEVLEKNPTHLKLEAHLMVDYPENWIDELVKINIDRVIFPLEDVPGTKERIKHLKNHSIDVGVSVNPETKVEDLTEVISEIDAVLVMSVHPGFGGQEFIAESLAKIKQISSLVKKNSLDCLIGVDGGVKVDNIKSLVTAGVDYVVMGSHLIEGNIDENLELLREAIKSE